MIRVRCISVMGGWWTNGLVGNAPKNQKRGPPPPLQISLPPQSSQYAPLCSSGNNVSSRNSHHNHNHHHNASPPHHHQPQHLLPEVGMAGACLVIRTRARVDAVNTTALFLRG
mmetsp:Transcript_27132/g.44501  ORF Transcript_27132/g.44501 Transcript_27132/m.44501 type:complete len:113 (+) Transcript_27132:278-616(+)